ncbi:hypothetical protein LJR071_004167 [Pseudomonas sp. LjRoot71]|uniref:hypothetical protein n=1 Tax=Pseudomonas sp. LjRoot71 TaxID=3342336 RepID=UPI003ECE433B
MQDTIENPYKTFSAYESGCSKRFIAEAYFDDFVEICDLPQTLLHSQIMSMRTRYMMLVDCLFDEGDVELIELRGWIDGAACALGTDAANFEWLHDAFEWVLK